MEEKFYFFWKHRLSQWHMCNFTVDGVTYCCAEQYMMAGKATLFNDSESLKKIMSSKSPAEHQKLGRIVKGYDQKIWDENARKIVFNGNYARFKQNEEDWKLLKSTIGYTLVESSKFDCIWGIGLSSEDPRALNRNTWRGKNWLGEVLTDVRETLIKENL